MSKLIEQLREKRNLTDEQLKELIETDGYDKELFASAVDIREKAYGRDVYIRGLIEISSYCKNDCYYCGIRRSNEKAQRYRLSEEEILECCVTGYDLGFRTFVLQGGEDPYFTDERICDIVGKIKKRFPDCAVTLSLGEKSRESYQKYFDAGADRYLLRHETAGAEHYRKLHPAELLQEKRMQCLRDLKEIGYQVGSGFMVGSPYQKTEDLIWRSALLTGAAAGHDRDRSFYYPSGYAVSGVSQRRTDSLPADGGDFKTSVSGGAFACDDSAGYDPSKRA